MKKMILMVLLIYILVGFVWGNETQSNRSSIIKILKIQERAWNNGDIDGFMTHYWKSDQLIFQSGKERIFGWDKMIERYKQKYLPDKMGKIDFFDIKVKILGADAAVVIGKVKNPSDNQSLSALFTLVLKKISGRWLIVLDHTS